jgi:hypothetical protein
VTTPTPRELQRALRERTRYLRMLTTTVGRFVKLLDAEMARPSDVLRGQRIAQACNALENANDHAKRFGLPRRPKRKKAR